MTPKQVAQSLVKYGKEHPEVEMWAFVIPQVPGSIGGATEWMGWRSRW